MRELSTHEVDELNEYEEINYDDLHVDVKIATLFNKMSKSEEERVDDLSNNDEENWTEIQLRLKLLRGD